MKTLSIFLGILSFACSTKKSNETPSQTDTEALSKVEEQVATPKVQNTKTVKDTISTQTFDLGTNYIVFITPDSTEIKQLKIKHGDDFYTIAHDENFYFSEAVDFLESRSMAYEVTKKRYVKLKLNHKWNHTDHPVKNLLIDTDTLEYKWIVIMHDGYDPPIISTYNDVPEGFKELDE